MGFWPNSLKYFRFVAASDMPSLTFSKVKFSTFLGLHIDDHINPSILMKCLTLAWIFANISLLCSVPCSRFLSRRAKYISGCKFWSLLTHSTNRKVSVSKEKFSTFICHNFDNNMYIGNSINYLIDMSLRKCVLK